MAAKLSQTINQITDPKLRRQVQPFLSECLDALQALADKLDADAGVTDVDYRTTLDGYVTD